MTARGPCLLLAIGALFALALPDGAAAQRFYPDDPLIAEPPPRDVANAKSRKLSDYYDFFENLFSPAGQQHTRDRVFPSLAVNTLGEPMEGAWYARRHYWQRMTIDQLRRGVGAERAPAGGPWTVISAKNEGKTPGFLFRDSRGLVYILKFDPLDYPEMTTGADIISSKIFHALGYHVPEYYVVHFTGEQLVVGDDVALRDRLGKERKMTQRDVTELLLSVPKDREGRYRGIASLFLDGKPLGPFRYYGTRPDDPNDIVPHEHRRDLRGLSVFCAWLAHDDSRAINTLDMLAEQNGVRFIKHHLIDFGSTLGSGTQAPNSPRSGSEYLFSWGPAAKQFITLGLWTPEWARKTEYPGIPAVASFESRVFDPVKWVPEYPNPAFSNRLPDDAFWATKQVMAFTDEELRAVVETAEYSDPAATDYIAKTLGERRDKIGRAFFAQVLPLDRFAVKDGTLVFDDLEVKHGFLASRNYTVRWSAFNNETGEKTTLAGETSFRVPAFGQGSYVAAEISGADPAKTVTVYLRNRGGEAEVVGIDRAW